VIVKLALAAVLVLIASPALAQDQGYIVVTPAGPASQVVPEPGGGALVVTRERPSTTILPLPEGSAATVQFSAAEQLAAERERPSRHRYPAAAADRSRAAGCHLIQDNFAESTLVLEPR